MDRHRVRPGDHPRLDRVDPDDTGKYHEKDAANEVTARHLERLAELQDRLYAEHRRAVLVVLQGMDTSGKDGVIKHVMRGVNPSGLDVAPFKAPTDEERAHDFLWRIHRFAPRCGHMTIFNRSHYEDVVYPFVHDTKPRDVIDRRYDDINAFERLLTNEGTVVLKFFLHISKAQQAAKLRERRDDPKKQWKFALGDLAERKHWNRYMKGWERVFARCSTKHAPWWIVPANHEWYRNFVVAKVLTATLEELDPRYPPPELPRAKLRRIKI